MFYPESESSRLEFKRTFPKNDQIVKTVIGFCNQYGGKLVIGVDDNGKVVGISEEALGEALEKLDGMIYQATEPSILPNIYAQRIGDRVVLIIEVAAGLNKPYFRQSEGVERGTYLRLGRSTMRATRDMIDELSWMSRGVEFERTPVFEAGMDALDRAKMRQFLEKRKNHGQVELTDEALLSYHLVAHEHSRMYPTVAGILLFGKQPQYYFPEAMIICSQFSGTSGRNVVATVDCEGTLIDQYQQALAFLTAKLNKSHDWEGTRRKDVLEIPIVALREALLNAIVHRNYHIKAPTKLAIYDDRVELFSPGQFPGPIDINNLRSGITYLRNPAICKVLREMGYVEKLGSGLIAILDSYESAGLKPLRVVEGENFIKYFLSREKGVIGLERSDEEKVIEYLRVHGEASLAAIQERFKLSRSTASRRMANLVKRGVVEKVGRTRSLRYRPVL